MQKEREFRAIPGAIALILVFLVAFALLYGVVSIAQAANGGEPQPSAIIIVIVGFILWSLSMGGFFIVQPNGSKVMQLFGSYVGTARHSGFFWSNPFLSKKSVSLRARTLNGERLKVNDKDGNPVEIAAIIVWAVSDTFEACFEVDNYEQYVALQSETAVRHLASSFPYDGDDKQVSLRRNTDEVSEHLQTELGERLRRAGVAILEARLSHLAYSAEIAGAMLRRQQAAAVIAARKMIVEGAVGMVEDAIKQIDRDMTIKLDDERKAAMVSNLMVVLCSDHSVQPVVNTGTLYH